MDKNKITSKMKKIFFTIFLLTFIILASVIILSQDNKIIAQAQDKSGYIKEEYSLNEMRQMFVQPNMEANEYIRKYIPDGGVLEYSLTSNNFGELQYESDLQDIQKVVTACSICKGTICNASPTRTVLRQSSKTNPIVIVLLADGFTIGNGANQMGAWNQFNPNPTEYSFLWYARNAMNAMLNTYPFNLYEDYFTFVADHTISTQQGVSISYGLNQTQVNNFFGSYAPTLNEIRMDANSNCVKNLALRSGPVDLIQIVANTTLFGGGCVDKP